ncbi:MAG: ABC transporter ATP-binding protein [Bacteroidaceae bacterium]|nr:ABC transporter ATP-binding protein [Bacteroidaceae bacterium]MBR4042261.1 ABC transporter ATP-binding protein [Bacteroidaceae bacterium]
MVAINNLKKRFGEKLAINISNYTISHGTMLGLVGNNGAGKTTLFRLILDLLKADEGEVHIDHINVSKSEEWKQHTGAFIDDSFLIDYLTPEEYFYFLGRVYGLKKEEIHERLVPFIRFMNGEVLDQKKLIRNFSRGNQQKIGIIGAMLHRPSLLILDEPFNFLDPSSQSVIKHVLAEYNRETGATILVSSHNLSHTTDVCNRIALLENGVVIRDIDNSTHTAEQELESYFNVDFTEEQQPQEPTDDIQPTDFITENE